MMWNLKWVSRVLIILKPECSIIFMVLEWVTLYKDPSSNELYVTFFLKKRFLRNFATGKGSKWNGFNPCPACRLYQGGITKYPKPPFLNTL